MDDTLRKETLYEIEIADCFLARDLAAELHSEHKYDGKPYVEAHLDEVALEVCSYTQDPVAIAVAYLHDVLEDTEISFTVLQQMMGETVANAVFDLTDGKGESRFDRQMKTYSRCRDNPLAVKVKLADRTVNMRASKGTIHAITYVNEYERFKGSLYKAYSNEVMWAHLDNIYEDLKLHMRENSELYIELSRNREDKGIPGETDE